MMVAGFALLATIIGAVAGITTLLGRYKDEPARSLRTVAGRCYILSNALFSLIAFMVLWLVGATSADGAAEPHKELTVLQLLQFAVFGGLGGLVILRLQLTVFVGGTPQAIGPGGAVETILRVLDRQVDRARAHERALAVETAMKGLQWAPVRNNLPILVLSSMRSLQSDEQDKLGEAIKTLDAAEGLNDEMRCLAIGFTLLDLTGEKLLTEIVKGFSRHLHEPAADPPAPPPPPPPLDPGAPPLP